MLFLAFKNLTQERTRLLISIGGVAFSVILMIVLQGLNVGFSNVLGQYLSKVQTDLWVSKANAGNIMDPSFLPLSMRAELEKIDGVASVKPFGMQSLTTNINGKDKQFYLISYDAASEAGKPLRVSEGKAAPDPGEIVIDRIVAKSNKVNIGDTLLFGGKQLKVAGFSEGTYILSTSFGFVNAEDAKIYGVPGTTNYWLVDVKPGVDVAAVQSAIDARIPTVTAHVRGHFVQVNVEVIKQIVNPVFGALVVLGAIIGTAVIGLTIFTSTVEKAKEYGILKAIGLRSKQLYIIVFEQALVTAVFGYILGVILALTLNPLLVSLVPQFITEIRAVDLEWIFAVTILMAAVATYIPIRRLNKIDPAEVFKA